MVKELGGRAVLLMLALLPVPALSEVGPHALLNVSQDLLRAYKAEDARAFQELLSPALQVKYPIERLQAVLARCRALTLEIDRFSIPSWGGRRYGFFGVYAETAVLEMILEIDESERIIHWAITDDVTSGDQPCTVSDF
ncbi:hypothetical protein HPT29_014170 [Microvirga terrae]|uniref:DUF4864 domain-containing protein n=1 Tax=Microvirga terrae TaxID=2740529 RepID=A0ABY5RKF4_9HYPH|nr:hypothetical protein [Microvirga terrae]UVF17686.1 hypothetical protein HPT29_014170 [Microvirga terrae]